MAAKCSFCRNFVTHNVPSDAGETVLDPVLGALEGVKRREIAGSRRSRQA